MSVQHVKSNIVPDFTGTVTIFNSAGVTATTQATALVRPSDWNSAHNQYLTLSGNAPGNTTASGTNIIFQAAGNISLFASTDTVIFSASQSVQTQSTAAVLGSTGAISFGNANGITFGGNASTITASHNGLTSQSGQAFSAGGGSSAFQTLSLADSNGVSWTNTNGSLAATVRTDYASSNHSHGNPTLALTNLSGTTASNSAGFTLSLSAGAGGAADGGVAVSAGANSQSTGTVVFSNSNGVSFGLNAGTLTASHNGLTTARASNDAVGLNTALTAGPLAWTVNSNGISLNAGSAAGTTSGFTGNSISGSMTHNTAGLALSLNHPAWLTTAALSNHSHGFSAAGGSSAFQTLSFANSNGITFSNSNGSVIASHNGLTTARASNDAIGLNTALTAGPLAWTVNSSGLSLNAGSVAGTSSGFTGANISASITHNTAGLALSMSVAAGGGANPAASASNGSFTFQTLGFSNANNVTFGTSAGSIITASVAAPGAAAEQNAINLLGANTAGNTTATGSTIGWSGVNLTLSGTNASQVVISAPATSSIVGVGNVSISTNGSTISISGVGGTATMWQPFNEGVNVLGQHGQATMQIAPLPTPAPAALGELQVDRLAIPMYWSNSSNSTGTATVSYWVGLYTRTGSSISLAHSTSVSASIPFSGTASSSLYNGIRLLTVPWTTTIQDGRYYVGFISRSTTAGGNGTMSQMHVSQIASNFSGILGVATNRSYQWPLGWGYYSASTTAIPSSIAFSQIDGTNSLGARPPSWFMISGTA